MLHVLLLYTTQMNYLGLVLNIFCLTYSGALSTHPLAIAVAALLRKVTKAPFPILEK
jgi:hypothetical protein